MSRIYAANESSILVNGEEVTGVQSLQYRRHEARTNIHAIGAAARIAVVSGPHSVEGRITVASSSPVLDALNGEKSFDMTAQLKKGDTKVSINFAECQLTETSFALGTGGYGEATYTFTATSVSDGS
jgi:hypothetical protein